MAKFKAEDEFYCPGNGNSGKILELKSGNYYTGDEYVVQWNHLSGTATYNPSQVDDLWELKGSEPKASHTKAYHEHVRKTCTGLRESWDYCETCGEKM